MEKIGRLAFLIGVAVAIVLGIVAPAEGQTALWIGILAVLGLIVGIVNVTQSEGQKFLIAAIALLVLVNASTGLVVLWDKLGVILQYVAVYTAPAALVVAGRTLWGTAATQ
jgi:hypothetical protein